MTESRTRDRTLRLRGRRGIAVAVGSAASIALLALAVLFTTAYGARQVADNARQLHWTNATLGSAAIARASNAQAVFFAVDEDLGVASPGALAAAVAEAERNLTELENRADGIGVLADDPGRVAAALDRLIAADRDVLDRVASGDVDGAVGVAQGELEAAYTEVGAVLSALQQTTVDRIESTEAIAGLVGSITRLLITLLIPAAAVIVYRMLVRRQALRRELRLQAMVDAERELGRAKDEFIAGVSHELRTPLTSIYGFSEHLIEGGLLDPEGALSMIGLINSESAELSRMVEDLLAAARFGSGGLEFESREVDLGEQVRAVVLPLTRAGAAVTVDLPERLGVVGDPVRIRQILRNLASNAHQHGGPNVRIEAAVRGDTVTCTVIDDGDAIPPDMETRLFERFVHRGHETLLAGSVGLGLSVARELARRMGGDVEYERAQGETRFSVSLPAAHRAGAAASPASSAPTATGTGLRVAAFGDGPETR